jgi:hypothetical protein
MGILAHSGHCRGGGSLMATSHYPSGDLSLGSILVRYLTISGGITDALHKETTKTGGE